MKIYDLIATSAFGIEAVIKRELQNLGIEDIKLSDGKAEFKGDAQVIAKCNLNLRCADRVLIKVGEFKALSFVELFDKTYELPWEEFIDYEGIFPVEGKSKDSKLFSISDSQRIVKKAISKKLGKAYNCEILPETKGLYPLQVSLLKDIATITLDTSGDALHKRGYRQEQGEAPIKETLAAAMILLSYWNESRFLADLFCGSGTIPIEAAMIAKNIAPGLERSFISADWSIIGEQPYKAQRRNAMKSIKDIKLNILASDIDRRSVSKARENAKFFGLEEDIDFITKDFREVDLKDNYGVFISNPPYGERMGEREEVIKLYKDLGIKFKELSSWSKYIISSCEDFEKLFGQKADRKRKLYNGRIKSDYYQYYGPKPKYLD